MHSRVRVLMSAYGCEPGKGSEAGVGWHVGLEMAKYCDVTVLTRTNNRRSIEEACAGVDEPMPSFLYHDLNTCLLRWKKYGRSMGLSTYYALWQVTAPRRVRDVLSSFDLVHHVTFNAVQFPGYWAGVGIPVILGPLGGGMTCPPAVLPLFGRQAWRERWRTRFIQSLPRRSWWKRQIPKATAVIAANEETAGLVRHARPGPVPVMLETAVPAQPDPESGTQAKRRTRAERFLILWLGSLIPRKAPILALMALREMLQQRSDIELWIAGDGPERPRLERYIMANRLHDHVRLHGRMEKEHVNEWLQQGDVFLFSSLRDTSGNVMLEAMNLGIPVVALDHHGARLIGKSGAAVLVAPRSPTQTVADLAKELLELCRQPDRRQEVGRIGQSRVRGKLTWAQYGERVWDLYQWALMNRTPE